MCGCGTCDRPSNTRIAEPGASSSMRTGLVARGNSWRHYTNFSSDRRPHRGGVGLRAARDFIDEDQWHHRATSIPNPDPVDTGGPRRDLAPTVRALYGRLRESRNFDPRTSEEFRQACHLVDEQRAEKAHHLEWTNALLRSGGRSVCRHPPRRVDPPDRRRGSAVLSLRWMEYEALPSRETDGGGDSRRAASTHNGNWRE